MNMSTWQDRLASSKVPSLINSVREQIESANAESVTTEERAVLDRLLQVMNLLESVVENSEAALINFDNLTAVENSLSNVGSYIQTWLTGNGTNYIDAYVIPETDTILRNLPLLSPAMNELVTKDVITSLRRSASQQKRVVDEIIEKIKAQGTLADETIAQKAQAVSTKVDEVQEELNEVSEQLTSTRKDINQLATEQTTSFNTAENSRTKSFNEQLTSQQKSLDDSIKNLEKNAQQELQEVLSRTQESETGALAAREKAEKLLNIVSQDALVTDYSKNANAEKQSALIWQVVTALSLLAAIVYAGLLAGHADGNTAWQVIASKFGVVVASGALATYAGRQSAEHRNAQRNAEHMALQLSAVQPYLEGIEDRASREALLIKLADRLFSERKVTERISKKSPRKDDVVSVNQLLELVQQFLKRERS